MPHKNQKPDVKTRLLDAALSVIRAQGYAASSVDDLCRAAGTTKGGFFHHFRSKEELGVAAANYWSETTTSFFGSAPYHEHGSPLERILAYIDFRKTILKGEIAEFTCLVGTMVQETYGSNPPIRDACWLSISGHAASLEGDIAAAMRESGIKKSGWTAKSLALHTQAVIQGAFVLAKAKNDVAVAAESIDHLKRYLKLLFKPMEK